MVEGQENEGKKGRLNENLETDHYYEIFITLKNGDKHSLIVDHCQYALIDLDKNKLTTLVDFYKSKYFINFTQVAFMKSIKTHKPPILGW